MKTKNQIWIAAMAAMLLTGVLLTGCASAPKEGEMEKLSRVATIAEVAAYTGAAYWLIDHPQDRPKVTMAVQALTTLGSTNGFNAAALHQALSSLPMKELKSEKGALLIGVAVMLYETELQRMTPIQQGPYVAVVSSRIKAGLERALAATNPTP